MVTDLREPKRNYPIPSTDNTIAEDFARVALALAAIGIDVSDLLAAVAQKAAAVHQHQLAEVIGLVEALNNKAALDHLHTLGALSDVDTAGATTYQVLAKALDGKWRPWTIDLANAIGGAAYAKLDGATFAGAVTVPTPSTAADSLNAVNVTALRAFVASAISALVASSPSTLDTLNEIAVALGNDPNFAATITALIGTKAAQTTQMIAGTGLTGGGDISANRTFAVAFATLADVLAGLVTDKAVAPDVLKAAIAAFAPSSAWGLVVEDRQSAGVSGGASVAGTWNIRRFNTVVKNTIGATLASNVITIPAGTWELEFDAPCFYSGGHQLRLVNNATNAVIDPGTSDLAADAYLNYSRAWGRAEIPTAAPISLRLEHYTAGAYSKGLGWNVGAGTEIYTRLRGRRIG